MNLFISSSHTAGSPSSLALSDISQTMRQGQGQCQVAATSAGPTDAAGREPEDHAPLLLGHVTEYHTLFLITLFIHQNGMSS